MSEHGIKKMEAIGFIELYRNDKVIRTRCFYDAYKRKQVIEEWYKLIKNHNSKEFYYQISYKHGTYKER
jgi:hypothetical protein